MKDFVIEPNDIHLSTLNEIIEIKHLDLSTSFKDSFLNKLKKKKENFQNFIQNLNVSSLNLSGKKIFFLMI